MLEACFVLQIEFFVRCFAKIIQLAPKGLHPVNASETQAEQGILSLLRNCLSHQMTCWVLRACWIEEAWAVTTALCGMLTSNRVQHIYGFFLIIISTFQDFFGNTPYLNSIPIPLQYGSKQYGRDGPFKVFLGTCNGFLQGEVVPWECYVKESSKVFWVIAKERPSHYDMFASGEKELKPCAMNAFQANYIAHVMWAREDQGIKVWYRSLSRKVSSVYMSFPNPALLKSSKKILDTFMHCHLTLMDCEQLRVNHSEYTLLNGIFTPHFYFYYCHRIVQFSLKGMWPQHLAHKST